MKYIYHNTDIERFNILKACYDSKLVDEMSDSPVLFDFEMYEKISNYYTIFEKILQHEQLLLKEKEKEEIEFNKIYDKAKLFVNHYFKALYMAIERNEMPINTAEYYGLVYPFKIPNPKNFEDFINLANKLFDNDTKRINAGGKYFTNPSIGSVKVWYEKFHEQWENRIYKAKIKKPEIENIANIRKETDNLIENIFTFLYNAYTEIEASNICEVLAPFNFIVDDSVENVETKTVENSNIIETDKQNSKTQKTKSNNIIGKSSNQLKFDLFAACF